LTAHLPADPSPANGTSSLILYHWLLRGHSAQATESIHTHSVCSLNTARPPLSGMLAFRQWRPLDANARLKTPYRDRCARRSNGFSLPCLCCPLWRRIPMPNSRSAFPSTTFIPAKRSRMQKDELFTVHWKEEADKDVLNGLAEALLSATGHWRRAIPEILAWY